MLSDVTMKKATLMFREHFIKVTIHLTKQTRFINFRKNGKDTNGTIIFDINFALLYKNEYNVREKLN